MTTGDNNNKTVAQVAREMVDRHGGGAPRMLRERAEIADAQGDRLSGETWRDIADAAEKLLNEPE